MGLIEKSIRKRSNQRLAEPISVPTVLGPAEILAVLNEYCDARNVECAEMVTSWKTTGSRVSRWAHKDKDPMREHWLHVSPQENEVLISFRMPIEVLESFRQRRGKYPTDSFWIARLRHYVREDAPAEQQAEFTLLRWTMGRESGKMEDRGFYEALVDNVFTAITSDPVAAERA
jgi:hypothetical protein